MVVDKRAVYAIRVEELTKQFGGLKAVDNISFSVKRGEIFGLLGPNGAGKTTLISMMTATLESTRGTIELFGREVSESVDDVRKEIGVVFQEYSLDDELTAFENLDFHARLYKVHSGRKHLIESSLRVVGLEGVANRQVKTFSGGMKRRLELARSFVHKPGLLFLDEPTTGLDVQSRRKIWDYIRRLNKDGGVTVFLTTHYLEEADNLCDRVAIIDHGKIIALDSPGSLKKRHGCKTLDDVFLKLAGHEMADTEESEGLAEFARRRVG